MAEKIVTALAPPPSASAAFKNAVMGPDFHVAVNNVKVAGSTVEATIPKDAGSLWGQAEKANLVRIHEISGKFNAQACPVVELKNDLVTAKSYNVFTGEATLAMKVSPDQAQAIVGAGCVDLTKPKM